MDLTSVNEIKNIFSEYDARPSKRMGQNFLIDKSILQKIITAAELKLNDVVLEIGPGIGTLTQELAKNAKQVIAVEKDKKMCEILKKTLKNLKNVEILNNDILKIESWSLIENCKLKIENYKVVANLPYYITSPIIRKFLENPPSTPTDEKKQPELMILMLQKEVAQRICSKPPNMSILSVSVQFYAKPEIISYVSKNCFWPSPKVDSAIIKITPLEFSGGPTPAEFFKIIKAGFSQPRKQLGNNFSKILKLDKQKMSSWLLGNNIKPTQRAETLSVEDWINLTKTFNENI
jgi:16S rRNA (adenine1518-N6/adenine1519-N6)-dimethyltransferase